MSIKDNPYKKICRFQENKRNHVGNKVFEYCALAPTSCLLPEITIPGGKTLRPTWHALLIGNSGCGKSDSIKDTAGYSYRSDILGNITKAELQHKLSRIQKGTVFINDLKNNLNTQGFEKVFEGMVDGHIRKETRNGTIDKDVTITTVSACVYSDIANSKKIYSGFLPRLIPIFLGYSIEQQKEVADTIAAQLVGEANTNTSQKEIDEYYRTLKRIQLGKSKHPRVANAKFDKKGAKQLAHQFKRIIDEIGGKNKYYYRDLIYGFKLAYNHAFLNYFNRKVENNTLKITKKDLEIGAELMEKELRKKDIIMDKPKARKQLGKMPDTRDEV